MAIICDPTLLQTRRGLDWLGRAVGQGCGSALYTSLAFVEGVDETKWSHGGFFATAQRRLEWSPANAPVSLLDHRNFLLDNVASDLVGRRHQAVAELWLGVREGHLLAARRPRVLDEFVSSGVELHVTSENTGDMQDLWPRLPHGLDGALVRRVRFLCRIALSPSGGNHLRVVDLGWGRRR